MPEPKYTDPEVGKFNIKHLVENLPSQYKNTSKEQTQRNLEADVESAQSELGTYNYNSGMVNDLGESFKPNFLSADKLFSKHKEIIQKRNDVKASEQSWYGNLLRGVGQVGTTFLREVGKLPGYIGGVAMSWHPDITIGEAMDNSWNQFFDGLDEDIKNSDTFKTYVSSDVQNGGLWDKMTSSSWWATTGADGVGNLLSFLVPGNAIKGLKIGSNLAKGTRVTKLIADDVKVGKFLKNADEASAAIFNATLESSMEASESFKNIYGQLKTKVDSGEMTDEEARKKAGEQAANVFGVNMLLLGASNMIDQKWLFGAFKGGDSYIDKMLGKALTEETVKPVAKKWYEFIPSTAGIVGKGFLKEGFFEEGSQFATSKYFENRALDKNNDANWFTGILGEYYDGLMNSPEFAESVFLGGVLGSPMSVIGSRNEKKFEQEFLYGKEATNPGAFKRFMGIRAQKSSEGVLKVLKDNYMNNFNEKTDLFEVDEKGNVKLDKNNDPIIKPEKRAQVMMDLLSQDVNKMDMAFAKATGNETLFEVKRDEALFNFMRPYMNIDGGRQVFEKHLNQIAEKEQKNLASLGENRSLESVKSEMMNKFQNFQNQYIRTSESMKTVNKLTKEQKTETPEFDALLTNVMMHHYIDQTNLKKSIGKVESEIAELEGSELVMNQKLAEPLKKRKAKMEEALKQSNESIEKFMTKEGQNELLDRYTKRQKEGAEAIKQTEAEETIKEDASKVTNVDHSQIYEQGTIIDPETNKKYHGGVTITNEEGKSYQADIIGLENGELKVRDKSGKEFTIKADGTINGVPVTVKNSYAPKIPKATNLSVEPTSPVRSVITEQKRNENKEKILAFINKLTNDRKGISNDLTQLENTIAYLDSLLEDTRNLSEKEINAIAKEINTLLSLIKSSSSKNTKYGENVNKKLQLLKENFRSQFTLLNDITDRVRVLKETLNQLSQIEQDLTKQIDYYNNLIANKQFETLSQTELLEQIETIKKKRSVIEKLISIITNAISKTTKAISEIFSMFQSRNKKLEGFIKRNNFKVLSTTELKKAIDEGTVDNYAELKAEYDKLEKEVLSILDEGDLLDNISKEERTRLEELQNTLSKYDNQLRYLKELILATTPSALNKKEITVKKQIDRTRTTPEVKKAEVNNQQNTTPVSVVETTPAPVIGTTVVDTTKIPVNIIEPEEINQEETYDNPVKRNFKDEPHAPFTGSVMDFFRTKGTQVEYEKNPEKYKPYLEFYKFIDSYDPEVAETNPNFRILKAFSLNTLPPNIKRDLPKELLAELANYPSAILLVVMKGNQPILQNGSYVMQLLPEPLLHGDVELINREERFPLFSYDKFREAYPGVSDEVITAEVQKYAEGFTEFRDRMLKSVEPVIFRIAGRNQGVLSLESNMEPTSVVGKLIANDKEFNKVDISISKNEMDKGIVHFNHAGVKLPALRQRLSKEDITKAVDLMKFYVQADNETDREKAHEGLKLILHIVYQSKGQKTPGKYTFYPIKTDGIITGFQYGEWVITKDDLIAGNTEHLEGKFLNEKFYSVDKTSLDQHNKGEDFYSYSVKDGKIVTTTYSFNEGGYKKYLLEGKNPKLKTKIKPLGDAQFTNRSFNIEPINLPVPEITSEEIEIVKEDVKTPATETDDFSGNDFAPGEETSEDNYSSPDSNELFKVYKPSDITGTTVEGIKEFKKKFKGFDLRFLSNGLINGIGVAAVTKNMEVIITDLANEGDLNHEAFHIVSQFFTTEKTRSKLYNETRQRLGKPDMTDLEAEEFLADEYQLFMESPNTYKFNKGQEVKKNVFQRLWNAFKSLFGVGTIEDMFKEISTKKYDKADVINKPSNFNYLYKIKGLDESTTMKMVKHYNVIFFDRLFYDKEFSGQVFSLTEDTINKVYDKVRDSIKTSTKIENKAIAKRLSEVENEHKKFLNQYGFQLEFERPENEQYVESNKISQLVHMPTAIKLLIAGLPKRIRANVNYGIIERTDDNFASTVDFDAILNVLNRELANLPEEIIFPKLAQLYNERKHPELKSLLDKMGVLLNSTLDHYNRESIEVVKSISPNATIDQVRLQTQFLSMFNQNMNKPLMGVVSRENAIMFIDSSSDTMQDKILADWKANLRDSGNSYFKFENGKYVLDKTTLYKLPNGIKVPVLEVYKEGDITKLFKKYKDIADYLAVFGITITNDPKVISLAVSLIQQLPKNLDALEKPTLDDVFNKDTGKVNKELRALANIELTYSKKNIANQSINGKGQTEYSISLPNKLSNIISDTKNGFDDNYVPYSAANPNGNLQTVHHTWNYEALDLVLLRSVKADYEDARDIDQSNQGDFIVTEVNAVLTGINPFVRAADRGLEYAFRGNKPSNFKISEQDMRDALIPYLENEIIVALAYQNDPKASHFVKSGKFSKELQFFKDIVPTLNVTAKADSSNYKEIAKEIMNKEGNREIIRKGIANYVTELNKQAREMFIKWRLVDNNGDGKYANNGFSSEVLSNVTTEKFLDNEGLNQLARTFSFLYVKSGLDQMKHIMGNLSTYNKKEASDLHKRTTLAAATKQPTRNSQEFVDWMNKYEPRVDGTEHTRLQRNWIIQDNKVVSSMIEDMKSLGIPGYDEMTENDAQGWSSLDGYKSMMYRSKEGWNDSKEKTYQYETQLFIYNEIYNNSKLTTSKKSAIDKFFKTHLPEGWKGTPMFKGEPIKIEEMESFPVFKPQGVGMIQNEGFKTFGQISLTKTSIAPILYSNVKDSKLKDVMVEMFLNGIDFIFPETAKKGEILGNAEGKLPALYDEKGDIKPIKQSLKEGYQIENLYWHDMGIQLDIDPSGKSKIKQSIQQEAIKSVNVTDKGITVEGKEELQTLIDTDKALKDLRKDRLFTQLVEDLGLSKVDGKYIIQYPEKFERVMQDEFSRKNYSQNTFQGIREVLNSQEKNFDTINVSDKVDSLLNSLINNNLISQKVKGDMMVQQASTGYETSNRVVGQSNFLKSYTIEKDADGNITKVNPAECMVPLPKEWITLVEQEEGNTFTDKLDKFNKKIQNKSWDKLLTFNSNRTPTQDLNSMEVMRVHKFLVPWSGSTIIVPSEIVVKAGSDFDVDKLNTYLNSFKFDGEGNPIYLDEGTESSRYEEYIITTLNNIRKLDLNAYKDTMKGIREEIKKELNYLKNQNKTWDKVSVDALKETLKQEKFDLIQHDFNLMSFEDFTKLPLYEQLSLEQIDNIISQNTMKFILHPSNYKSLMSPNGSDMINKAVDKVKPQDKKKARNLHELLSFDTNMKYGFAQWKAAAVLGSAANNVSFHSKVQKSPIEFNSDLALFSFEGVTNTLGNITNEDAELISVLLGQYVSAAVDAAKESEPALTRANISPSTANLALMLTSLRVKPEHIVKFLTDKEILKYESIREVEEAKFLQVQDKQKYRSQIITDLLGYSSKEQKEMMHNIFKGIMEGDSNYNVSMLKERYEAKFSKGAFVEDKLEYFLYLSEVAKMYGELVQLTKHDSGMPKNRDTVDYREEKLKKLIASKMFSGVEEFFDNTFMGKFREMQLKGTGLFNEFFTRTSDERFAGYLFEVMQPYKSAKVKEDVLISIQRKLTKKGLAYILHTSKATNIVDKYADLLKGKNSLAKRLLRLKNSDNPIRFNPFIQELVPVIEEYIDRRKENLDFDYIRRFSSKISTFEEDSLADAFKELMEHPDTEIRQLGTDIIYASIIQSGLNKSASSFFDSIPVEYFYPIASEALKAFKDSPINLLDEQAIETIYQNSWMDKDIVKRQNAFSNGEPIFNLDKSIVTLGAKMTNAKYDYITVEYKKENGANEIFLYKKGASLEDGKFDYVKIDKKGEGNKFTEFTSLNEMSLLKNNNITIETTTENTNQEDSSEDENIIEEKFSSDLNPKDFTNYSGAAQGGDTVWANMGKEFGIGKQVDYRPEQLQTLTADQKLEVENAYQQAVRDLGRNILAANTFAGGLVRRDYLQAKSADAIFAISTIIQPGAKDKKGYINKTKNEIVEGGTGYAVQMAINLGKPVYVFDQLENQWYKWDPDLKNQLEEGVKGLFVEIDTPILTPKFAGIGTREIEEIGKRAIRNVYEKTFGKKQIFRPSIPIQIKKDAKSNWSLELTYDGKVINTKTGQEVDGKIKNKALTKHAFQTGFGTRFTYNGTEYAAIITNSHNTSLSEFKIVSLSESNMGGEVFKQGTPQYDKIIKDNNNVVELLQKICSL